MPYSITSEEGREFQERLLIEEAVEHPFYNSNQIASAPASSISGVTSTPTLK